jgi:FSR family fosmidomycin resistance protein-like MFS transporter
LGLISRDTIQGHGGGMAANGASAVAGARVAGTTVLPILLAVSAGHFLNDTMQSALLSLYPLIKGPLALDFVQIGIITLTFQLTASILQPMIGLYSDKRPQPFSLPGWRRPSSACWCWRSPAASRPCSWPRP